MDEAQDAQTRRQVQGSYASRCASASHLLSRSAGALAEQVVGHSIRRRNPQRKQQAAAVLRHRRRDYPARRVLLRRRRGPCSPSTSCRRLHRPLAPRIGPQTCVEHPRSCRGGEHAPGGAHHVAAAASQEHAGAECEDAAEQEHGGAAPALAAGASRGRGAAHGRPLRAPDAGARCGARARARRRIRSPPGVPLRNSSRRGRAGEDLYRRVVARRTRVRSTAVQLCFVRTRRQRRRSSRAGMRARAPASKSAANMRRKEASWHEPYRIKAR